MQLLQDFATIRAVYTVECCTFYQLEHKRKMIELLHAVVKEQIMVRAITGERIASERKRLGMTQSELGDILGKHKSVISRMESTGQHLTVDILDELADIFGCSTDYLLGRTDRRR